MKSFNLHLYLVTDEAAKCRHSLLETVRKAVDGGVTIVQYRSTNPDAGTCYREALPIRDFLAARGIPFIVNNRIDLGAGPGCGRRPHRPAGPSRTLRARHDRPGQNPGAVRLQHGPAPRRGRLPSGLPGDGARFPDHFQTQRPARAGRGRLRRPGLPVPLPVVAIGGLDAERARQVRATGTAAGIAAVSAICGAEDPEAAARALA